MKGELKGKLSQMRTKSSEEANVVQINHLSRIESVKSLLKELLDLDLKSSWTEFHDQMYWK